jgi:hypothetical protein
MDLAGHPLQPGQAHQSSHSWELYSLARTRMTVGADQGAPVGVATLRAFISAAARSRTERQARRTPAAELRRARGGPLVGCGLPTLPRFRPRVSAPAKPSLVRLEISDRSFSARVKVKNEWVYVGPSSATMNGTLCAIKPLMKCTSRLKRSSFEATHDHCSGSCGISASVRAPVLSLLAGSGPRPAAKAPPASNDGPIK